VDTRLGELDVTDYWKDFAPYHAGCPKCDAVRDHKRAFQNSIRNAGEDAVTAGASGKTILVSVVMNAAEVSDWPRCLEHLEVPDEADDDERGHYETGH
jgi:hypothetical protein